MDDLERIFRQMVRAIEAKFPQYLTRPFEVAELYQTILPYRHFRRELGFETNQDYELALTHLLAGEHDYLVVEDRLKDTLVKQLQTRNPDPGAFREFGTAHVSLNPDAVRALAASPASASLAATSPSPIASTAARARATPPPPDQESAPPPRSSGGSPGPGAAASRSPTAGSVPITSSTTGTSARGSTPIAASSRPVSGGVAAPGESCRLCAGR